MSYHNTHRHMIACVAKQLGDDLLTQVAFVGGCTTGLHITDDISREAVRYTDDVDLIIHVIGYSGWNQFGKQLCARGFSVSMDDEVNCRFRLGQLCVDFMPDDPDVLGYSNRWYGQALADAQPLEIEKNLTIRLVTPWHFLATKFEAFKGRGGQDLLASRDIEDILNIINGREELLTELPVTTPTVRDYLAQEFSRLIQDPDIDYAIQSTASGDVRRAQLIRERIEQLAKE